MRARMVAASYTHKGVPKRAASAVSCAAEKGVDMELPENPKP
jgi:hypothetical protein